MVLEKNDKSINLFNILHYVKVMQERKPLELNNRNITNICNRCGLHSYNTGKPLINESISNNLLIEKIDEEEGFKYYEISQKGIEAHDHLKRLFQLIWSDKVEKLTEWYDK